MKLSFKERKNNLHVFWALSLKKTFGDLISNFKWMNFNSKQNI